MDFVEMIVLALGIYTLSTIASLSLSRNYEVSIRVGSVLSAIASAIMIFVSALGWVKDKIISAKLLGFIPIHMDVLSYIMTLAVSIPALSVAIYTYSYMDMYREGGRAGIFITLLNMFIASMIMIVICWNLLVFLFCWEVMTLASYILIVWDYEDPYVRRAGLQYAVAMHIFSSIPLILAVLLTYAYVHAMNFTLIKKSSTLIPEPVYTAIVALLAMAFISKAGLVPLHFWLPDAHSVAPSNISALLSGVMIKMAVYGIIRLLYYVYSAPLWLWCIILASAISSSIWGSLKAVSERNSKRILAYSSVSHIGYMVTAVSSGALLLESGNPLGLSIMVAGIVYLFTHSILKSLLFLITGCYLYTVRSVDVDDIYGAGLNSKVLIFASIIGLLSIAGLPPTLGYLAKIYVYGTLLLPKNLFLSLVSAILIAVAPLSAMYIIKIITPSLHMANLRKPSTYRLPLTMRISLSIPSSILIALGLVNVFNFVYPYISTSQGYEYLYVTLPPMIYSVPIIIGGAILLAYIIALINARKGTVIINKPWTTGYVVPLHRHRISASRMYIDVEDCFRSVMSLAHEIYYCLTVRLSSALLNSGISRSITSKFNALGNWIVNKLLSLSQTYESKEEFKVDESTVLFIYNGFKAFKAMARVLIVSPIGLFTIVIVFLTLLILILFIVGGIAWKP